MCISIEEGLDLLQSRREVKRIDRSKPPPLPQYALVDPIRFYAAFGVGDMVGVEGTEDRVVNLSPRSELSCPMHDCTLVPDACRSCRFLAGEVGPASQASA
jgi:hypothetical protein